LLPPDWAGDVGEAEWISASEGAGPRFHYDPSGLLAERHTGNLRPGMFSFPLPVLLPEIMVSLLWHPRLDAEPAHRWLRECVREVAPRNA
jgi:DNA-binding transcriptional LysR family regulator